MFQLPHAALKWVSRHPAAWRLILAQHLPSKRVPLHDPSFPLVLLFSQKAGCTALLKWFFFQVGRLEEAQSDTWIHSYRHDVFMRQDGYVREAVRLMRTGERPVVKLVRNPYDRAVSAFLHTLVMLPRKQQGSWVRPFVAEARARAGRPADGEPRLSFRKFVLQMERNGTDILQANVHVAQQFVPAERNRVSRIIKLEGLVEELRRLEAEFRLKPVPLDALGSRHHRKDHGALAWAGAGSAADLDLSPHDVVRDRVPAYEAFYDAGMRELVRRGLCSRFRRLWLRLSQVLQKSVFGPQIPT